MKNIKTANALISLFIIAVLIFIFLSGCQKSLIDNIEKATESGVVSDLSPELKEYVTPSGSEATDQYFVMPPSFKATEEDFIEPEWMTDYESILEEYRKFVDYSIEGGAECVFRNAVFSSPDFNLWYQWDCMIVETNIFSYRDFPKARESFGYALKDLNGNGSPELILMLKDYTVLAVFSQVDDKPRLLDAFWPRHRCAIDLSGLLYIRSSSSAEDTSTCINQISQDGSELLLIFESGHTRYEGFYMVLDGERQIVSQSELIVELDRLKEKYIGFSLSNDNEITSNSGLEYILLFD